MIYLYQAKGLNVKNVAIVDILLRNKLLKRQIVFQIKKTVKKAERENKYHVIIHNVSKQKC